MQLLNMLNIGVAVNYNPSRAGMQYSRTIMSVVLLLHKGFTL